MTEFSISRRAKAPTANGSPACSPPATPIGGGFSQRYGYFEMRAELPPGPGVWPAFWLNSNQPKGDKQPGVEIDVIEYYGQFPDAYHSAVHVWDKVDPKQSRELDHVTSVPSGTLSSGFHTFGVDVEPDWITSGGEPTGVDAIYVQSRDLGDIPGTLQSVTELLSQSGMSTGRLQWVTPATLALGFKRLKDMVAVTAGGVAVLSLLLGGITLASLMLANVRDRVVEIGLRRAFGARTRDIVQLFILEALCITTAASVLGSGAAMAALLLAGPLPLPADPDLTAVLLPLVFGLVLGALAAWWPARLAARIQPAQALRSG